MDDLRGALQLLTDLRLLLAFILVIIPGFVSLRAYESIRGIQARKINEAVVDVLFYGLATVAVSIPIYYLVFQISNEKLRTFVLLVAIALLSLGVPILVVRAWCTIQASFADAGFIAHPDLKPWDRIFHAIKSERLDVGIILTLRDGRKLGGRFGRKEAGDGFASSYPACEQLLIGEPWKLTDDGQFVEKAASSRGLLIDKEDVLALEFIDWEGMVGGLQGASPSLDTIR